MRRAFTLIELLVIVAIVGLLISILLPSLAAARTQARTGICMSNMRQLAFGWHIYADENNDIGLPGRYADVGGGKNNPANYYYVGNGMKYRPRWIALMGRNVGIYAFGTPEPQNDRQDYDDNGAYRCPEAADWLDERNHAYGYNHQFLGNGRQSNGRYINFPVRRGSLMRPSETVLAADSLGTAAGLLTNQRLPYENNGTQFAEIGNHAYTLDPPRLTAQSDRGDGEAGSTRTAVDPRHGGKSAALFIDGHAVAMTPFELGYRILDDGRYMDVNTTPSGGGLDDVPTNRLFSGVGIDLDAPPKP